MPNSSAQSLEEARKATAEAAAEAERALTDLAKRAEKMLQDGLGNLRGPAREYADVAGEQLETAQKYLVEKVNERPVAAAVTALGVGVVIGVLLAGRSR